MTIPKRICVMMAAALAGLWAHDLYLRPPRFRLAAGAAGRIEFHNGEAFPKSQVPPVLARVAGARIRWAGGERPMSGLRIEGTMAVAEFHAPAAPAFLALARTTPNFIELDARKFGEYLAHENLDAVRQWRQQHGETGKAGRELYSKYVKSILHTGGPDAFVTRPVGETVEFVPAVDPASLQPGQALSVQLLFRGAPAKDVAVEATWLAKGVVEQKTLGRTDAQGRIEVPLKDAGLWKLHAIVMERRAETAQADWESFWASLTFEVEAPGA